MARTADHPARRRQIVAGVRAVALADGLGAVTMAKAARQAGVSVGLVQHYYGSKEELLADTLRSVLEEVLGRVERAVARSERRGARIEHMVAASLEELLPLDARRRDETYLRHAFAGLALDDEELRGHQRQFQSTLVGRAATAVSNGVTCGEVSPDADPALEASTLVSLADGMAARLLVHDTPRHRRHARAGLRRQVSTVFAGPCSREERPEAPA